MQEMADVVAGFPTVMLTSALIVLAGFCCGVLRFLVSCMPRWR